ncbi:MAG: hypothetical protein CMM25_05455 [Rhodospirillaceae bacterium]|nr:hypothetical protein [Rhodospirillaceae bacterium]
MAITSQYAINQASGLSPEVRQVKSERKRIESYIRSYERNPKNWTNNMIGQLEMLSTQYQVPFRRVVPEATAMENLGAGLGGVADSLTFGLMPDDWYSSEATRKAANVGKIGGTAAQIVGGILAAPLTGGASMGAVAKGLTSLKGATAAAKALNKAKQIGKIGLKATEYTPYGAMSSGAMKMGKAALTPYGNQQGWKWAQNETAKNIRKAQAPVMKDAKSAIDNAGDLGKVVKGQNLSSEQVKLLTNRITRKYGKTGGKKMTTTQKDFMDQLGQRSGGISKSIKGMDAETTIKAANALGDATTGVKASTLETALKKAGLSIKGPQQKEILKRLQDKNITTFGKEASDEILKAAKKLGKNTEKIGLNDIDKFQGLGAIGLGAASLGGLGANYTKSREDLERTQDPFDPYN